LNEQLDGTFSQDVDLVKIIGRFENDLALFKELVSDLVRQFFLAHKRQVFEVVNVLKLCLLPDLVLVLVKRKSANEAVLNFRVDMRQL